MICWWKEYPNYKLSFSSHITETSAILFVGLKLVLNILKQRNLLSGNHPWYYMAIVPTTALYDCD